MIRNPKDLPPTPIVYCPITSAATAEQQPLRRFSVFRVAKS